PLGSFAFAVAFRRLHAVGWARIADAKSGLAAFARRQPATVPGVSVLGPRDGGLGVIPFTMRGRDHRLVAAVLGHEHGVGVRSGCFCAQPYVHHLLGLGAREVARWVADARRGDLRNAPGVVRISLGSYNDRGDIDRAVEGLRQIAAGPLAGSYFRQDDGSYLPAGELMPRWFRADQAAGSTPRSVSIRRHAVVARAAPARSPSAAAAAISTR
ncbi:MAG: aminotransferase class V-fold PLP-dependent enzyme, partial [Ilumatobacteraceae bacterium]